LHVYKIHLYLTLVHTLNLKPFKINFEFAKFWNFFHGSKIVVTFTRNLLLDWGAGGPGRPRDAPGFTHPLLVFYPLNYSSSKKLVRHYWDFTKSFTICITGILLLGKSWVIITEILLYNPPVWGERDLNAEKLKTKKAAFFAKVVFFLYLLDHPTQDFLDMTLDDFDVFDGLSDLNESLVSKKKKFQYLERWNLHMISV